MIQAIGSAGTSSYALQGPRAGAPPKPPDPRELFQKVDGDGDGSLNLEELQAMLEEMAQARSAEEGTAPARERPPEPTAEELLSRLDTDGDGLVSQAELEAGRPQGPPPGGGPGGSAGPAELANGVDLLRYLRDSGEDDERRTSYLSLTA